MAQPYAPNCESVKICPKSRPSAQKVALKSDLLGKAALLVTSYTGGYLVTKRIARNLLAKDLVRDTVLFPGYLVSKFRLVPIISSILISRIISSFKSEELTFGGVAQALIGT